MSQHIHDILVLDRYNLDGAIAPLQGLSTILNATQKNNICRRANNRQKRNFEILEAKRLQSKNANILHAAKMESIKLSRYNTDHSVASEILDVPSCDLSYVVCRWPQYSLCLPDREQVGLSDINFKFPSLHTVKPHSVPNKSLSTIQEESCRIKGRSGRRWLSQVASQHFLVHTNLD